MAESIECNASVRDRNFSRMNGDGEAFSVKCADTKEATFDAVNVEDVCQGDFCKFARCNLNVSRDFAFAKNPKLSGAIAKGNRSFLRE